MMVETRCATSSTVEFSVYPARALRDVYKRQFVDIGVHQDGLVHISQISNRFIRHPGEVLKVGDVVTVWVLSVDVAKKRISLTMKQPKGEKKES